MYVSEHESLDGLARECPYHDESNELNTARMEIEIKDLKTLNVKIRRPEMCF